MNSGEHKTDSVGGSPVSIDAVSAFSDLESVVSLDNKRDSLITTALNAEETAASPTPSPDDVLPPVHPEFAYEDGNIELQTSDHIFWVHEFLLKRFSVFAEQIKGAKEKGLMSNAGRVTIKASSHRNSVAPAFRVLYVPVFPGPEVHKFNSETLIKTLRIATVYGCPDLRKYAISELERRFTFLPIHRIEMSDEFNLPNWEKPAFIELCRRPEPISKEEADILGLDRLLAISQIREAEQRRKFVELVDKSVRSHGLLDQRGLVTDDKLRTGAEYTLKYSSLPKCDCRIQRTDDTESDDQLRGLGTMVPAPKRHSTGRVAHPQGFGLWGASSSGLSVVPCQIHHLAPRIASESHALLKQRNDLVRQLGDLKVAVSNQVPRGERKDFSVEGEIDRATWVRKMT